MMAVRTVLSSPKTVNTTKAAFHARTGLVEQITEEKPAMVNPKLANAISKIKERGLYLKLVKILSKQEFTFLKYVIETEPPLTLNAIEKITGKDITNPSRVQRNIIQKANSILESREKELKQSQPVRRTVEKILDRIEELKAEGKTMEEITEKFNENERRVLENYVMVKTWTRMADVAVLLNFSKANVCVKVRNIFELLNGRSRTQRFKDRYEKMSKKELTAAILATGITDRATFREKTPSLANVAYNKGVLDTLMPKKIPKTALNTRIRKAYDKLYGSEEEKLETILRELKPIEREFLKKVILSAKSMSDEKFIGKHEHMTENTLRLLKTKILRKLNGEEVVEKIVWARFHRLQEICKSAGNERLNLWKKEMNESEVLIIERRITANTPELLESLGVLQHLTKERMRQIEEKLLEKMEKWNKGEAVLRRKPGKAITRITELIAKAQKKGIMLGSIEKVLTERENEVLRGYVLAMKSLKDVSEKIGITQNRVSLEMHHIEIKIIEMLGLKKN